MRRLQDIVDVAGGQVRNEDLDRDVRVNAPDSGRGGDGLWSSLRGVAFRVQPLALEVAPLDIVAVDQEQTAGAGARQCSRVEAPERPAAYDRYRRTAQPRLSGCSNSGKDN